MKAVFRISTRLRNAAPIPRGFLPIKGLEHLGLIYQQRIITTPEEFNETLVAINDPRFPSRGCSFFPYLLTAEDEAKMNAAPVVEAAPVEEPPAPEPVAEDPPVEESPVEQPANPEPFRLVENDIFQGDERVGGIYENGLRCSKGFAHLRDEIDAWLNSQPQ